MRRITELAYFNRCPECGEARMENLELKREEITCLSCGHVYSLSFLPDPSDVIPHDVYEELKARGEEKLRGIEAERWVGGGTIEGLEWCGLSKCPRLTVLGVGCQRSERSARLLSKAWTASPVPYEGESCRGTHPHQGSGG